MSRQLKDIDLIREEARHQLGKEAQAYHDLTMQGDPDRAFFAYLYCKKTPTPKFVISFADIITRLGAAWSPALRTVIFRMARTGRLLVSTFHKPPSATILGHDDEEERTPYQAYDSGSLSSWVTRRRADSLGRELEEMDDAELEDLDLDEID